MSVLRCGPSGGGSATPPDSTGRRRATRSQLCGKAASRLDLSRLESLSDLESDSHCYRWWKRIPDLAVSGSLTAGEAPNIRKALQPRSHANGEPRKALEFTRRSPICQAEAIDAESGPFPLRSRGTEVGASMLLRTAHQCWRNPLCASTPRLSTFPTVLRHQVVERVADGWRSFI